MPTNPDDEAAWERLLTWHYRVVRTTAHWYATLERWETTITESPRPACTAQVNPLTKQVEVRCR
jgi:hypothetical protein